MRYNNKKLNALFLVFILGLYIFVGANVVFAGLTCGAGQVKKCSYPDMGGKVCWCESLPAPTPTITPTPTLSEPTATPDPNITITPTPIVEKEIAMPVNGTLDYCKSMSISATSLDSGSLTITSTAKTSDIVTFGYAFYNKDNNTKPIMFTPGKIYSIGRELSIATGTQTVIVNFSDINKKDTNWNNYMPKPKNIEVWAYFKDINGKWSKWDKTCSVSFAAKTIDPTPTPNAACVCSAAGKCTTACFFDKFATTSTSPYAYSSPIKCSLSSDLFTSVPTQADKDKWCRNYYRTKGDANGDGKANLMDYFYFLSARSGQKLPPSVNVDFDGDGYVTEGRDRAVIIQSLIP